MNRRELLDKIDLQELPQAVKDCEKSIREDNPSMEKGTAIAICRDMHDEGELADTDLSELDMTEMQDDPCEDGWVMVGTKTQNGQVVPNCVPEEDADPADLADACPGGQVMVDGECKDIESVEDVPPSALSLPSSVHLAEFDPEQIERIEESEDTVRYTNIRLIGPGVWRDSASRQEVWYSPKAMNNLEVSEDNAVHINHDDGNDVSEVGEVDPESVENADNGVFGDIVVDTSSAAGEFADQNLQQSLESGGAKGFGGPSVEIPPEGQEVRFNDEKGLKELVKGVISGLGLVSNPGAKNVHFGRQTAQAAVALAGESGESVMEPNGERIDMADPEDVRETLEEHGVDTGSMDDDELMDMASTLHDELMGDLENAEHYDEDGEEDEEEMENADNEDDEEEEEEDEMDMGEVAERVESLDERLTNVEDMMESAMAAEDVEETLSEEVEDATEELADADTVQELEEAKEELEARLSELEDEPEDPKTLADGDETVEGNVTPVGEYDSRRGTYSR